MPAGAVAIFAGLMSILGSFMLWARDTGDEIPDFLLVRRVAAFDSNGPFTLLLGVGLVIVGILLIFGMKPLWLWSILSVVFGTLVLACVIWAYVDITGRASDDWAEYVAAATGTPEATISTFGVGLSPALGLWITALGGLLGVLTAPLARRGDD